MNFELSFLSDFKFIGLLTLVGEIRVLVVIERIQILQERGLI